MGPAPRTGPSLDRMSGGRSAGGLRPVGWGTSCPSGIRTRPCRDPQRRDEVPLLRLVSVLLQLGNDAPVDPDAKLGLVGRVLVRRDEGEGRLLGENCRPDLAALVGRVAEVYGNAQPGHGDLLVGGAATRP